MSKLQIEMRREYQKWYSQFWGNQTTLSQIIVEEFPDGDDEAAEPTRYQIDMMRGLAAAVGALVEGYDDGGING